MRHPHNGEGAPADTGSALRKDSLVCWPGLLNKLTKAKTLASALRSWVPCLGIEAKYLRGEPTA